jgi:Ca2+-transporting ATPase
VPVNKKTIPLAENTSLADRLNMVFKGTFIAGGYAVGVVTETGINTAIGNIAQTLQTIKTGKTNFQKKTDKLALQMSAIAVASASLLFIIAYFFYQASVHEILLISIAAFVSSIPEGLPAVLAIVLAIGAYRMSQRKAIIREFTATETLGAVTTIITDKTGTLTQNTLTVRNIFIYGDSDYEVTGSGWSPEGDFFSRGEIIKPQNNQHLQQLLLIAGWSNNADIHHDKEKNIYSLAGDPTEGALLALAIKGGKSPKNEKSIIKLTTSLLAQH